MVAHWSVISHAELKLSRDFKPVAHTYIDQIFCDSLYSPWFQRWVLQLAEKHNTIIACGNYLLLPESTGVEILSDIDDFWKWLHTDSITELFSSLPTPIELDLESDITTGGSTGGF
jgi:hypothetical protein